MHSYRKKTKIIAFAGVLLFAVSCKPSLLDVITNNGVGYWSRYEDGYIHEYSKKDSMARFLDPDWKCVDSTYQCHYRQFYVANDTLFEFIDYGGRKIVFDTTLVVSYSKNTLVVKGGDEFGNAVDVVWKRRKKNK